MDDDGDGADSLMRRVAAAPPVAPPPVALGSPPGAAPVAGRGRARIVVAIALAVAVAAVIGLGSFASGATEGQRLRAWTLGDSTRVELPSTLIHDLPLSETDFVLRTRVVLAADQRGHQLTLVFDCFHGPLALAVDGRALDDSGDTGVGEHVFVIPSAETDRPALELEATPHRDALSALIGFGAAPRLVVGTPSRTPAVFDRYIAIAEIIVIAALGLVFAAQYLFDRRRRADGAFAIQALAALAVPLWQLGILARLGSFGFAAYAVGITTVVVALLAFLCFTFPFGAFPRRLAGCYVAVGVVSLIGGGSFVIATACFAALLAFGVPLNIYILPRLFRFARRGDMRFEARLLLGAAATAVAAIVILGLGLHLDGWHFEGIGIFAYAFAQAVIVAGQHVKRSREVERANEDLRRQVAERSKQLADALAAVAQQQPPPAARQTIDDRYRVVRKLGAGGMGSVYEVERIADGARLALKTLRGRADAGAMARLAREAQIAAELSHPNLLAVTDVGVADGELFLVMPLIAGGPLSGAHDRFGDARWALPILAQVAQALATMHARGIIHRDLKPSNILLDGNIAKVADFGIAGISDVDPLGATLAAAADSPRLTGTGALVGTPLYMAPELARDSRAASRASDVYSLGVVAYELLAAKLPHAVAPVLTALAGQPVQQPPPLATLCPQLAADVCALVDRCLDAKADARPTADMLGTVLSRARP